MGPTRPARGMCALLSLMALCGLGTVADAQSRPLSAIDWLSAPLPAVQAAPVAAAPEPKPKPKPAALPVTGGVTTPEVIVTPLDTVSPDGVGLLPASETGFPRDLWQGDTTEAVVRSINALPRQPLPALQALIYTVLLAESTAQVDAGSNARVLRARLESLIGYGAVYQAFALLERAGPDTPALFSLWFDTALLLAEPDAPCRRISAVKGLQDFHSAAIYCTARLGDWPAAALTYENAVTLDLLAPLDMELLAIYLDPELAEAGVPDPRSADVTPLRFRLWESAGEPLSTTPLPLAYAVTDLSDTVGWKAQIEAAERLSRQGALTTNRLLGLYTERQPAASGGVWDRVRAVQALDSALTARDDAATADALIEAWRQLREAGLAMVFADLFAERLDEVELPEVLQPLRLRIALLSDGYEHAAQNSAETPLDLGFARSVALGMPDPELAQSELEEAIVAGFTNSVPPLSAQSVGRAVLDTATDLSTAGLNYAQIERGLARLRSLGLEDVARRAALQWLLLGMPG